MILRSLLPTLLCCAFICACGNKKKTVDNSTAIAAQEANDGYSVGRITTDFISDGCPLLVKLEDVSGLYLIPIALDDKYKKNGLRLKFKYRPSKATSGECRKGNPVVLEDISVMTTAVPTRALETK